MANIDTGAAVGADGRAGDGTAAADAPLGGAKNRYNDTDHATDTPLDGAKNRYSGTDYATDPPRGAQTQRSMGQAQKEILNTGTKPIENKCVFLDEAVVVEV